jgi:3-methyladenine DNA glycosylase AlkD
VKLVDAIDGRLRALGSPDRARQEKAYLKSQREHWGVGVPAIRSVAKTVRKEHPEVGHDELIEMVESLWDSPVHERRMVTLELLGGYHHLLRVDDISLLERLLRESGTWALVDGLAESIVGGLVERCPELAGTLDHWAVDEDFWIRRAAMLALLHQLRRGGGDFERFSGYADGMLEEKEFFIRKAIGWVLRDTGKRRPELVFEWLLPRAHRASGVTLREAVKPLSGEQRAAIAGACLPPPGAR